MFCLRRSIIGCTVWSALSILVASICQIQWMFPTFYPGLYVTWTSGTRRPFLSSIPLPTVSGKHSTDFNWNIETSWHNGITQWWQRGRWKYTGMCVAHCKVFPHCADNLRRLVNEFYSGRFHDEKICIWHQGVSECFNWLLQLFTLYGSTDSN